MGLTNEEKNKLVEEFKNIVFYVARRYDFFDDFDDVVGWGFVGLTKAINEYEELDGEIPLPTIAFPKVRAEILNNYKRAYNTKESNHMEETVVVGKDGDGRTLMEFLSDEHQNYYDVSDIIEMFEMALFEQTATDKAIIFDYYLSNKTLDELAEEYGVSKRNISKTCRIGQALIKQYMFNNGTIVDYTIGAGVEQEPEKKVKRFNELNAEYYGRIKYIRKYFTAFDYNDIATLLQVSSYEVMQILRYPTTTYLEAPFDKGLKEQADRYMKIKYPHMIPSEVKVYEMV